jgi:hypothetical protein
MNSLPFFRVKKGSSDYPDTAKAIDSVASQLYQEDTSVTFIFFSSYYDMVILEAGIQRLFSGPVIACSTAGEINENGYSRHSMCGISISSNILKVQLFPIYPVNEPDNLSLKRAIANIRTSKSNPALSSLNHFGIILVDGLSGKEEIIASLLGNAFPEISITGGSAGDDLRLENTWIYADSKLRSSAAIFALFSTSLPFYAFKSQHFTASEKRFVITRADPQRRIVYGLNGATAAEEYSRIIGVAREHLCPDIFARFPFLLNVDGEYYVRLIKSVNSDGSLTMFCALDEGLDVRIGKTGDIAQELENTLKTVENKIGPIALTLGFDCVHRRLESNSMRLDSAMNSIFKRYNVMGFCTYGEQIDSVHVNQTFTAVAIGAIDE